MTSHEVHEPTFHDTDTGRWTDPDRADFGERDLEVIDDHYLVSESGFPPAVFGDLHLPVVDPDGELNRNALRNAHTGPASVETLDVDEETERRVKDLTESYLHEAFDADGDHLADLAGVRFEAYEDYREHRQEYRLHHEDPVREADAEEVVNPDLHADESPHSQQN